jgi:hypothetical protein
LASGDRFASSICCLASIPRQQVTIANLLLGDIRQTKEPN